MENETEQTDAHTEEQSQEQKEEAPTHEAIADLKSKAAVSSQNFERAKKAEEKVRELEAQKLLDATDPFASDDPVAKQVADLAAKLQAIEDEKHMNNVFTAYPILKDKQAEFDEFRQAYPGMNLTNVAKVFLAEHDLLGGTTKRKGLEKAGGGARVAPESGKMSSVDVERLRKNNHKEYLKLIRSGQLNIG